MESKDETVGKSGQDYRVKPCHLDCKWWIECIDAMPKELDDDHGTNEWRHFCNNGSLSICEQVDYNGDIQCKQQDLNYEV